MKNNIPTFQLTAENFKNTESPELNYGLVIAENISQTNLFELVKRAIQKNFRHLDEDAYEEFSDEKIILYLNQNAGYKRKSGMEKSIGLFTNRYEFEVREGRFSIQPTFVEMLLDKDKKDEKTLLSGKSTDFPTVFDKDGKIRVEEELFEGIEDKTNAVVNVIVESVLSHLLSE